MLTIAPLKKASDATSYYARDNYYTQEDGVEHSWWQGNGAADLNLVGKVDADVFERLLTGKITEDVQLGRLSKNGIQHRPGWDFTFSAPKSLSILSEIYGVDLLRQAHEEAVKAALLAGEQRFARTRLFQDGKTRFEMTNNLIVAAFTHDVSRELEPQIHTHTIHMNATNSSAGWKSLAPELFFKNQHQFSRVYKNELAKRVRALGFELRPSRFDTSLFEISGVSDEVIDFFSTRSQQIRQMLESQGIEYNSKDAKLASLITRRKKQTIAREELRKIWRTRADQFLSNHPGLSNEVAQLVNALQTDSSLSIEVPHSVFTASDAGDINHQAEPWVEHIEKSAHATESQATDALATQSLKNPRATVIAKDELQKIVLDESIRRRLTAAGKLKEPSEIWENKKRVFLTKQEKTQTQSYRVGDQLITDAGKLTIAAIKPGKGIVIANTLGEKKLLLMADLPNKFKVLRQQFLELRTGEKIRFTSEHPELAVKRGSTAVVSKFGDHGVTIKTKAGEAVIDSKNVDFEYAYSRIDRATKKVGKEAIAYIAPEDDALKRLGEMRGKERPHTVFLSKETAGKITVLENRRYELEAVRPVRRAIRHLQEREMSASFEEIIATAKRFLNRQLADGYLENEVKRLARKAYLLPAPAHPDKPDVALWTTMRAIKKEDRLGDFLNNGKAFNKAVSAQHTIESYLAKTRLNENQKAAVVKAMTSKHQYFAIQGDPGVGKTTTLKELRTFAGRNGYDVYGFAPSHQAVKELSGSIKTQGFTVDRILVDAKQQAAIPNRKSLWIVDEAGMLPTEKINRLMALAEKKKAKVLWVGDHQQLESVGAGRGFAQMLEEGIDHAVIDKRLRQKTDLSRSVVDKVMAKQYGAALSELQTNNRLTTTKNEIEAVESLVKDWKAFPKQERASTLIVAPTNEQRELIDQRIREVLRIEGSIGAKDVAFTSMEDRYLTEQQKRIAKQYKVGDVIRFNKNYSGIEGQFKDEIHRDEYVQVIGKKDNENLLVIKNVRNGRTSHINPMRIGGDREGAITVYRKQSIKLSVGDQVRWTDSRGHLGIAKNAEGVVTKIGTDFVRFKVGETSIKIQNKDLRDAHLCYNYSKTAYNVQGATSKRVLALMEGWRKNTTNQRSFMVALTRASEDMKVYTSTHSLAQDVARRTADNTRAKSFKLGPVL